MIGKKEINHIRKLLRQQGLRNSEVLDELTDHYLTEIEGKMKEGLSFEMACQQCLSQYQNLNLKKLNWSIFFIHHKSKIIMASFGVILLTLFSLTNHPSTTALPDAEVFADAQITEESLLEAAPVIKLVDMDPPSIWPVKSAERKITSGFGMRNNPQTNKKQHHTGVDIRADFGTPVVAPEAGTVEVATFGKKKGNYLVIKHDETYSTVYYHLQSYSVKVGQKVKKGEIIGEVGSSGYSFGPHLHYEVVKNGKRVDPMDYLSVK